MKQINFAFIGSGKMLRDCINVIKQYNQNPTEPVINIKHTFIDPSKAYFDDKLSEQLICEGIPATLAADINSKNTLRIVKELDIDYMISVNNHQIFKKALITAPKKAVLNFHNGPLPKYGGLNACTWAIYNNESMHGVTWHYMSEKIDQGEIIVQSCFDINNSDTAISLIMKSVIEGVKLFRGLLPDICKDSLVSYKQDLSKRTYYPSNQIPNSGYIDFSWGSKEFQRFRKAFSVYPFTNLLPPPRVKIANETYELLEYDYVIENTEKICLGQMYYDKKKMLLLIGMKEGFLEVKKVLDHELDEILLKYSSSKEA